MTARELDVRWRYGQVEKGAHMVRTANMTDVVLRRSSRIKAGLEERMLYRFHTLSRKRLQMP